MRVKMLREILSSNFPTPTSRPSGRRLIEIRARCVTVRRDPFFPNIES